MEKLYKKNQKPRYGRIIFVIACVIFAVIGITTVLAKPDPYKAYREVGSETKQVGEQKELIQEISGEKMKFLHYPEFAQEKLDKKILDIVNGLPDQPGITFLDYDSSEVLEQYITVTFHYQNLNMEEQIQDESTTAYTFHKDDGKEVALQDVLRRDYRDLIKVQFQKQASITVASLDEVTFAIGPDAITLNAQGQQIKLSYADYKAYIKIPGKGISDVILKQKRTVSINPDQPMIALTFDDGPSPYTDEFMRVFEEHNATASFFMLGQNVNQYPDTVKHMVEYGFEVCNHSWDHKSINSKDKAFIKQEVFDTQDAIYKLTGHEPTRFRPPFGDYNNKESMEAINGNGVNITLWNVDTRDWDNRDAARTLEAAKAGARDGAIILFHDLYPSSLSAVKELVPYLQKQGYQLVTVSDLFQYKGELTGL